MANIMSMVKLRNHTSRNAFDLSRRNVYTAKVGELLPVACIECIPGDKIKARVQHFTRTMPVNTAAYTVVREYYDWYFVPTNLLWNKFNTFVTQMTNDVQHAASIASTQQISDTHPYFNVQQLATYINQIHQNGSKNPLGFKRSYGTVKLLNYLGYGNYDNALGTTSFYRSNANLNPFPLLAYQKIYQDYYRHSQWENSNASAFNMDYLSGSSVNIPISTLTSSTNIGNENMFDLRYANWNKDLFMGLLPNAQYGSAASIVLDNITPSAVSGLTIHNNNTINQAAQWNSSGNLAGSTSQGASTLDINLATSMALQKAIGLVNSNGDLVGGFSILALRQAEALQRWKEITQSQQQDYKTQIEAHFGVSMSDAYSERCRYVDGSVSQLDISEVMNTNLTSGNDANIAGRGVGVGEGSFDFSSDVHGYLMCIYHATPLLDYSISGISRMNLKTKVTDYAIPEFDRTGMVSVPLIELTNSSGLDSTFDGTLLGYAPRYYDYKQAIDEVHGAFRGTLGSWVAPVNDSYITSYIQNSAIRGVSFPFFKVNPSTLNPIFGVDAGDSVDTDQLLVNASFDITAVRNLDRNGLPY